MTEGKSKARQGKSDTVSSGQESKVSVPGWCCSPEDCCASRALASRAWRSISRRWFCVLRNTWSVFQRCADAGGFCGQDDQHTFSQHAQTAN